jgi:hypothetical protein
MEFLPNGSSAAEMKPSRPRTSRMIKTWNFIIIEAGMGYHVVGKSTIDGAERIVVCVML